MEPIPRCPALLLRYSAALARARTPSTRTFSSIVRPRIHSPLKQTPKNGSRYTFRPQLRKASSLNYWRYEFQKTWNQRPIALSFTIGFILALIPIGAWMLKKEWSEYKQLDIYPKDVGVKVRRAIYFRDAVWDPERSAKNFMEALALAQQHEMDPLSDEVVGFKLQYVRLFEKTGDIREGIVLLEQMKRECLTWTEAHKEDKQARKDRSRVLWWAVRLSNKLGELYGDPRVANRTKTEQSLVWAVETTLRERQRREKEGVTEDEMGYFNSDDLGSHLEDMGHIYEAQDKHYYAAQLFVQALSLKQTKDCHAVILMNNVAAAIAQQTPPTEPGVPQPSREQLRESGRAWVRQALVLAASIKPPERTEECDFGCVVATHNLGEFAEMDGNIAEAVERYEEAGSIAHAIGFEEGAKQADQALKRLRKGKSAKPWW